MQVVHPALHKHTISEFIGLFIRKSNEFSGNCTTRRISSSCERLIVLFRFFIGTAEDGPFEVALSQKHLSCREEDVPLLSAEPSTGLHPGRSVKTRTSPLRSSFRPAGKQVATAALLRGRAAVPVRRAVGAAACCAAACAASGTARRSARCAALSWR